MDFYRPPTSQGTLEALGSIYRAVRAWKFYPKVHPICRSSLSQAHLVMQKLLGGNTLSLACGRTGFSFPDGEFLKDASGMSTALAYELFVRRIQKITFSPDLFQEDLLELFKILCLSSEVIQQSGGIDTIMAARGIRTIWVNEFDLTAIQRKRLKVEQTGIVPKGFDETESGDDFIPVVELRPLQADALLPEQQLQSLIRRLITCDDEDTYLMLIQQAVACADLLQSRHEQYVLFPLIELLAINAGDEARSEKMRECTRFAIEQIITTGEFLQLVLERIEQTDGVSDNALYEVLKAGGTAALTLAVELLGRTKNLKTRKTLSIILGRLGEAAVPVLLGFMNDSHWFIVRNICTILGSIANREALAALAKCLHHPDLRVRKEAIRSLAQIGGQDAEAAILGILRGTDTALYPQAIASLGGLKSRMSFAILMKIVLSRDFFLKSLSLKIDALAAIALIGDRQVTPNLVAILEKRHLLAAARGKQLKAAAAICLGKLGDRRALPSLKKLASDGGELGSVCAEAIVMIEKAEGRPDEIT